jgi:putative ABC transport system permease protein
VDERLGETAWPGESPVGQTVGVVRREYGAESRVWDEWKRVEVVGVVPSIRGRDVRIEDPPTLYVSYSQNMWGRPAFMVRSDVPLEPAAIREAAGRADPRPLLSDVRTLDSIAGRRLGALRFAVTLIGVFAALGLTLAATGVYGLLAYAVGRRERELNIRAALGADSSALSLEVLRWGLAVTGTGVLGGLAGAWWLTRLIEALLFDVRPADPSTFAAVASFLAAVALLASWMPARRARRRNPVEVLR